MTDPTTPPPAGWSTPKFLLIAFGVTAVLMFVLNGVLNELLGLGIHGTAFGAAAGVAVALLMRRWAGFQTLFTRAKR